MFFKITFNFAKRIIRKKKRKNIFQTFYLYRCLKSGKIADFIKEIP